MKRALLVLCLLALLSGCSYILPQSNQTPKAYINAITPSTVTEGETVTLSGYGTDVDGEVAAYRWRSDRDGQLGVTAEFETSSLSVGEHVISFTVQDNNDAWSSEARGSVTVVSAVSAPVRIDSFAASSPAVSPGESVTLSWSVANASTVSVNQGIGTVSSIGSALVTPDVTITYKLTATGGGSTVTASVTVSVRRSVLDVTLTADGDFSGFVRSSGSSATGFVYVGDDSYNRGFQGFVTFDISRIPDDAVITRVIVDLSDYETPYDLPFPPLGCLSAYVQDYKDLDSGDYRSGDLGALIEEWCDFDDLDTPTDSPGFRSALQQEVGEGTLQFRLQFADGETDGDSRNDLLRWPFDNLPRMSVEYQTSQK